MVAPGEPPDRAQGNVPSLLAGVDLDAATPLDTLPIQQRRGRAAQPGWPWTEGSNESLCLPAGQAAGQSVLSPLICAMDRLLQWGC